MLALVLVTASACAARTAPAPAAPGQAPALSAHENLNAVLWMQTALEYEAAAIQAYKLGEIQVETALKDRSWTAAIEQTGEIAALKPAVIVDVDETVLDNSYYQARMIRDNTAYSSATWDPWVQEARATAIPGALAFTTFAASRGVTIFYVTNRTANLEEATRKNLRELGFPLTDTTDTVLSRGERPEWQASGKGPRRAHVARDYRILLLIGDDLGDFIADASGTPAERHATTAPQASWWGQRWIMLPNPTYGSWERAIVGTSTDHLRLRRGALKFEPSPKR
jgi:5'-nucleotidase (lipoprotein e(P4) family)